MKGVTLCYYIYATKNRNFNSHAREGRDKIQKGLENPEKDFNSHAREGRDDDRCKCIIGTIDFNSHAREGRDKKK